MRRDRNRAEQLTLSSPLERGGLRFVVHRSSNGGDRRRVSTSVLRGARRAAAATATAQAGQELITTVSVQPEMLVPCTSTSTLVRSRRRRPPRLHG